MRTRVACDRLIIPNLSMITEVNCSESTYQKQRLLVKVPNMKSAETLFGGRRSFSCGRTYRMKLIVAFRNRFAKAPKNGTRILCQVRCVFMPYAFQNTEKKLACCSNLFILFQKLNSFFFTVTISFVLTNALLRQ
jgi:hypothetical protein